MFSFSLSVYSHLLIIVLSLALVISIESNNFLIFMQKLLLAKINFIKINFFLFLISLGKLLLLLPFYLPLACCDPSNEELITTHFFLTCASSFLPFLLTHFPAAHPHLRPLRLPYTIKTIWIRSIILLLSNSFESA